MPAETATHPETCPHCGSWVFHRSEPCRCRPSQGTLYTREALGERLRYLRESRGWSLEQVAAKVEMSKTYLWELEQGRPEISLRLAWRLALLFGVSLEFLATGA